MVRNFFMQEITWNDEPAEEKTGKNWSKMGDEAPTAAAIATTTTSGVHCASILEGEIRQNEINYKRAM